MRDNALRNVLLIGLGVCITAALTATAAQYWPADHIIYDNAASGLTATTSQAAIDELVVMGSCEELAIETTTTEEYLEHPGGVSTVTLEPDTSGDETGTVVEFFVGCTAESVDTCPTTRHCWNDKDGEEHCELDGNSATKSRGTDLPGAGFTRVVVTTNGAGPGITPVLQACRLSP